MNDFELDEKGDIMIARDDVQLVSGKDLTVQRIKQILGTNKGEWKLDENEGINMRAMLQRIKSLLKASICLRSPNTASGISLDRICPFAGITRNPATYAQHSVKITGAAGVVIISGMSGSTFTKDSTYNVNIMFMVG